MAAHAKVIEREGTMLQRGESVPHFEVNTFDGGRVSYSTIWQQRNLVLVTLPAAESERITRYRSELKALLAEFDARNTDCVVTADAVAGVPAPGALVADKWGEIAHLAAAADAADLPSARELLEWADHLQSRCPECEGESK